MLDKASDGTAHVRIALQASAHIKDYLESNDEDAADQLYNDPFYSYLQNATNDLHSQYPFQKMAVLNALETYKRYLGS